MRQAFRRRPVPAVVKQKREVKQFPAPIRGLVLNRNPIGGTKLAARVLFNGFCTETAVKMRKGNGLHATIGAGTEVESLFSYTDASNRLLFAANQANIYDITEPADAEVSPSASVSGQNSGVYSTQNFETTGGHYLYALNGQNDPRLFDGTTWTAINGGSTPAITGVTTSTLSSVWAYKNRLYFVERNTTRAWYLAVDSIGGAASSVSLAGVFSRGGALLFGATWSLDSRDSLAARCVFVSTEGEVAVYQGADPGAADWALMGVYEIGKPLGEKATLTAGGDLIIATEIGMIPLSSAIVKDPAALSMDSVSQNISPIWDAEAESRGGYPWHILKWPAQSKAIVSIPGIGSIIEPRNMVVNTKTGAWSEYTGMDTSCTVLHDSRAFYGTSDGLILEMEQGGTDNSAEYSFTCLLAQDSLGQTGFYKTCHMARAIFNSSRPFNAKITALVDYNIETPAAPNSPSALDYGVWDVGLWDNAVWDSNIVTGITSRWRSVGRSGIEVSPLVQMSSGSDATGGEPAITPDVELVSIDILYETGGIAV